MSEIVDESKFYMWRTLFAVVHADNIVTSEEISFMSSVLSDVNFSDVQTEILKDDITNPKDIEEMFKGITLQEDRVKFFEFARNLVWVDGDFAEGEQNVMIKLFKTHFNEVDFDALVSGSNNLELESDEKLDLNINVDEQKNKGKIRKIISSFKRLFS